MRPCVSSEKPENQALNLVYAFLLDNPTGNTGPSQNTLLWKRDTPDKLEAPNPRFKGVNPHGHPKTL